ncbi:Guanylate-binding family protein [Zea mays]|uniref:Guanylate-binding family protein n=1 Tax=Zea mays TaxID=4577 RepID=A0A1D6HFN9_MAIZE|nr:Guanylate-binding family protein [Zea mays]
MVSTGEAAAESLIKYDEDHGSLWIHESVGKSNVYDDRIFALATVLSSVLVYNLPKTIREADISRLSFAVEIVEEFYVRVKGQDVAFEPAKLLWLIQRDFLRLESS